MAIYKPFLKLYHQAVAIRRANLSSFLSQFYSSMLIFRASDSQPEPCISREFKSIIEKTSGDIANLQTSMDALKSSREQNKDIKKLSEKAGEAGKLLREILYPTTPEAYANQYGGYSAPMQVLRSDIRGLKGMLLSRRNFPTVQSEN